MRPRFVKTTNVERFAAAVGSLNQRGAPEASFMLVGGDAGYGKSRCGQWWAVQNGAVLIRIKAAATAHWVLTDLVKALGERTPAHSCERLFTQAVGILAKDPRPIVIDEVENALAHELKVLETIRDVSDLIEVPVILIGREYVRRKLKRHRQFWTRISAAVEFGPCSLSDVAKCCTELAEVPIAEDLVAAIHQQSEGHIREVIKAIRNVERVGLRQNRNKPVELDHMKGLPLCQDFQRRKRKVA